MSSTLLQLEPCVDELISLCHELHQKNQELSQQLKQVEAEKSQLFIQNQQAATKIKKVMQQLREEIHERVT